jgi:hypothetical protein
MSLTAVAAVLSTVLAIYSGIPYIRAVLNGKTKPHQLSWLVFTIMNSMVFLAQYLAGGRSSTLISLTFAIYSFIIFILSFSKGTRNTSRLDKLLFTFALVAMVIWVLTRSNEIAIVLTLLIDLAATTMIILKVRVHPNSEAPFSWLIGTIAYVFSCITLINVHPGILYVRPIYGLLCDGALTGFIYYFRAKQ